MMKSEALRCDYCGGFVNPTTYKCPYCGTQYEKPKSEMAMMLDVKHVTVNAPIEVIGTQMVIPMNEFKTMKDLGIPIEHEIRRDMANQIAEAIADKIEIYEDNDIIRYQKTYRARLRLVKPDYRF